MCAQWEHLLDEVVDEYRRKAKGFNLENAANFVTEWPIHVNFFISKHHSEILCMSILLSKSNNNLLIEVFWLSDGCYPILPCFVKNDTGLRAIYTSVLAFKISLNKSFLLLQKTRESWRKYPRTGSPGNRKTNL